jgi:PAS domain S-box-containing protein
MQSRSLTVVLLDTDPAVAEVADILQEIGHRVLLFPDAEELVRLAVRCRAEVAVVPAAAMPALRVAREQVSTISEPLPVLALVTDPTVEELEQLRAKADDVLSWPSGHPYLGERLQALVEMRRLHQEATLRRAHAQTTHEIAATLGASVSFEDLLFDALLRIVESACAQNALVLVAGDDPDHFYVMGASDDAASARLPVPAIEHPEVAEAVSRRRELALCIDQDPETLPELLHQSLIRRRLGTLLVFPLLWDGEAYGCLEVCFDDELELPEATMDLLREAAALIGHTLRSSDVYLGLREQTHKKALLHGLGSQGQLDALQKYEEFFQRAFDGIFVLDRSATILHVNPAGEQITGYSRRGLVGKDLRQFVSEDDRALLASTIAEMGRGGLGQSFDLRLLTTSGDSIIVSVSPSAVIADDELVVLSFRDVTEARALENELRSTKEFLERLIDSTVDAIVATDIDGKIVLFNQGAERIFGLSADEVVGKMLMKDLYTEGLADGVMASLRGPDDGGVGRLEAVRKEVLGRSGELVPVLLSANLINEDGVEVGTVGIYSDLRERLRTERVLAQTQEKLIETEKQALIAELAGTTAHELNQPLTSIMGYAELLKRRIASDDSNHRAVDTILTEAERMAEIVRKIGKITRYETKAYVGGAQILDLEKSSG